MTAVPESHRELLARPLVATLATVRPDGTPQCNPVWFDWDGTHLRLSQESSVRKLRNMRADPHVSLVVVDPGNAYHYLEVRGVVDAIEPDEGSAFLGSLAARYLPGRSPGFPEDERRVVVRIRPTGVAHEQGRGGARRDR